MSALEEWVIAQSYAAHRRKRRRQFVFGLILFFPLLYLIVRTIRMAWGT